MPHKIIGGAAGGDIVTCNGCGTITEMEPEVPAHLPDHWEYIENKNGDEEVRCPMCLEKKRADNDFRIRVGSGDIKAILKRGGKEALFLHTFSGLPPDRKGLIAAFHPLIEYSGDFLENIHETMKRIVLETGCSVFFVMTEAKWRLILFGYEREPTEDLGANLWYDDEENGEYANDQFISHYDTNGKYHVDGVS